MASLVLELSNEVYEQLKNEAARLGKQPQTLVQELITSSFSAVSQTYIEGRVKLRQLLKEGGLLAELDPELQKIANPNIPLQLVEDALSRDSTKLLSEIVIEQRG